MYFRTTFLVVTVWTLVMTKSWATIFTTRESIGMKNEKILRDFYDALTTDDIDDRLNTSVLESLHKSLSDQMYKLDFKLKRNMRELKSKLQRLDVSFKRLQSFTKNCNIVLIGLRYVPEWSQVCEQLTLLTQHFGFPFDEHQIKAYEQVRMPTNPEFSRLKITFKKVNMKQLYMLKFKQKMEEYEKEYNIYTSSRKLALVPGLDGCRIFMLDDLDPRQKVLMKALKSLQRVYPNCFNCYIKDSRVYYKIYEMPRPAMIDRQEDILRLERRLFVLSKNKSESYQRTKTFRSGTVFSYNEYQYNRSRKTLRYFSTFPSQPSLHSFEDKY